VSNQLQASESRAKELAATHEKVVDQHRKELEAKVKLEEKLAASAKNLHDVRTRLDQSERIAAEKDAQVAALQKTIEKSQVDLKVNCVLLRNFVPVEKKVAQGCHALFKLQPISDIKILRKVYFSLIYPHLQYAILTWGRVPATYLTHLKVLHNRSIRCICKISGAAHVPMLDLYH